MTNLINISEGTSLALHGLVIIAQQYPTKVNARDLAQKLNASEAHLAKIFQRLGKSGIVKSYRGPAGGFALNKPAEEISFINIIEVVDSKVVPDKCPLHKSSCPFNNCIFGKEITKISNDIYQTFQNIKLSDFIK
ncbi:MAG: Rrf2 family transcriptional regulator [Candidatus Cloacimonetes bacterium]|nr:Rrf2 family transcriptional regulator [Candidatus Cloacimonadota bacterium]